MVARARTTIYVSPLRLCRCKAVDLVDMVDAVDGGCRMWLNLLSPFSPLAPRPQYS
jgi:hypothetical protein